MKLVKREITLNECDSLKDVYFFEKYLMSAYMETLAKSTRKEVRGALLELIKEVGAEMGLVADLLQNSKEG